MERRYVLKLAGMAGGAVLLAAAAQAAPLAPSPIRGAEQQITPAVTTAEEVGQLKPQQVHWGHGHHWGWHHRHWGWHRWHHRHWRWHHRWHRHRWHRW